MAAAPLADVLVGDPHPAVALGARRSSARAGRGWPPRRRPGDRARRGLAQPQRERVADALELADARGPAGRRRRRRPTRCPAGGRPTRRARRARARGRRSGGEGRGARGARRRGETGSSRSPATTVEWIRSIVSGTKVPCVVPLYLERQFSRACVSDGEPHRLLDRDLGHALDTDRTEHRPLRSSGARRGPTPIAPNSSAERPPLVGDHQRPGRELARAALERLTGRRRPRIPGRPRPDRRPRRESPRPTRRPRSSARRRAGCGLQTRRFASARAPAARLASG